VIARAAEMDVRFSIEGDTVTIRAEPAAAPAGDVEDGRGGGRLGPDRDRVALDREPHVHLGGAGDEAGIEGTAVTASNPRAGGQFEPRSLRDSLRRAGFSPDSGRLRRPARPGS
jgi:hypothetical protein